MIVKTPAFFEKKTFHIICIFLLCFLVYLPIASHQFVFDDNTFFVTWQTPKSFSNLPAFFQGDVPTGHEGVYRPVRTLLYAIDYALWGGNPLGYYLQAILLNAVIALLIYGISLKLTKNIITAFAVGMLFGLQPVHTEAITFATASMDTFGLGLAFGSFYLYLLAGRKRRSWKRRLSVILTFIAFLAYEVALILPFLYTLYEFLLGERKYSLKKAFKIQLPYFIAVLFYIIIRLAFFHIGARSPVTTLQGYFYFLDITSKAFYQYITTLLFPINLSLNHLLDGFGSLDQDLFRTKLFLSQPVVDIHNIISLFVLTFLIVTFISMLKRYPLISFCIGWFLLSLIPFTNILPTETFFNERWLFFASFGFCLLLGIILTQSFDQTTPILRKLLLFRPLVFVLLIIFYILLTSMRNHEWKDSLTFWTRTLEQSPQSSTALSNLGTIEQNMGNKKLAMSYYLKAISFDPLDSYSHNDIGTLYFDAGQYGNAIDEFKEAIALYGVNPTYITNLNHAEVEQKGSITRKKILSQLPTQKKIKKPIKSENEYQEEIQMYLQENDINDAIKTLEQATTDYHINSNFYDDLGVLYISQKNYNKALLNLQNAIAIDPGKDAYYYNLGITLEALGRQKDAKKAFQTALNLNQNDAQVKKELENLEIKGF